MRSALVTAALLLVGSPAPASVATCTSWKGQMSGNDPDVDVGVELCRGEGPTVTGRLRWSSPKSGENVRRLAGQWSNEGDRLILRDVEMLVERPKPGWRFCLIDRYDLKGNEQKLTGHYVSTACHDQASVTLTRK